MANDEVIKNNNFLVHLLGFPKFFRVFIIFFFYMTIFTVSHLLGLGALIQVASSQMFIVKIVEKRRTASTIREEDKIRRYWS